MRPWRRADENPAYYAEALEDDLFEWHFAIFGPEAGAYTRSHFRSK